MKRSVFLFKALSVYTLITFISSSAAWATYLPLKVEEQDGSPTTDIITKIKVSNGTLTDDGSGTVSINTTPGAPTDATYITQTANGSLSAEQALAALSTGLLKNTTGTGVLSVGVAGTDYLAPAAIGVTVQAWDADLDTWATKAAPAGTVVGTSDTQSLSNKTFTTAPVISVSDANDTVLQALRVNRSNSSAVGGNSLGSALDFYLEDSGSNLNQAASMETYWDDSSDGSEDSSMLFKTVRSGGLSEAMRISSQGFVGVNTLGTPAGAMDVRQLSNSTDIYYARRSQDTSSAGDYFTVWNAAGNANLFRIGPISAGLNPEINYAGAITLGEMAEPALSASDKGRIYFDTTANKFKVSENGGAYTDLINASAGDVVGPGSSVDNAIVRFDGTTGKLIQDYTSGAPTVSDTGAMTLAANLTTTKTDPSLLFDVTTATDTDFWMGVQEDAGGDDDDKFQIGDGLTPGTNPFVTIDTAGQVGIGTTSPDAALTLARNADASVTFYSSSATDWQGTYLSARRSRGTLGSPSAVQTGDALMIFNGFGYANGDYRFGGSNAFYVEGAPVGSNVPTYYALWTSSSTGADERLRITSTGNVGIADTIPDGKFDVTSGASDNVKAAVIDQLDTDQIALDVNASNTTADVVDLDGSALTTGNLVQATVTDTLNSNVALVNVTGTALDTATNVTFNEISTTPANDVDITAFKIERGTNDARLVYDEGATKWQIDQGAGGGLVDIATGGSSAPTDATYITQTANGSLSAEQALSALSTGLLKNTTGTGVLSVGVAGTDYLAPAAIGVTVQAWDADLDTWATKAAPSGTVVGTSDTQTLSNKTFSTNTTFLKADPSLLFDVTTATDTDFWMGVQDDAGGDDDDKFHIGKGLTPGSNSVFRIDGAGNILLPIGAQIGVNEVSNNIFNNFTFNTSDVRWYGDGNEFLYMGNTAGSGGEIWLSGRDIVNTSGGTGTFGIGPTIAPTSGTVTYYGVGVFPTINQTGGANGVTRGVYINPTITAAADFRAMETTQGNVLVGTTSGSLSVNDATPDGKFDVTSGASDNVKAAVIDQLDTDQIALDVNASNTTADVVDLDGSALTTGNLVQATVTDALNSNVALVNVTGTTLNTATNVTFNEISTTPANDVDVTAFKIERGANDARLVYDEGSTKWQIDQGAGGGLVDIATGTVGSGDVVGPASSVDNSIVRFDGTTGKLIQGYTSGSPTISDSGAMSLAANLDIDGGSGNGLAQVNVSAANPILTLTGNATNGYYPTLDLVPVGSSATGGSLQSNSSNGGLSMVLRGNGGLLRLINASSSATNSVTDLLSLEHNTTGTPAAGFGTGISLYGESDTTQDRQLAKVSSYWSDATDASRTSKLGFFTALNGTVAEKLNIDGSGNITTLAAQADLRLQDDTGGDYVAIQAPTGVTTHTLTLPAANGSGALTNNGSGTLSWTAAGSGDASTNTSSSVDSEITLFSGTGGKTLKRATGTGLAVVTSGVLSTVTAPSGTVVGTTDTQTLTNKTLTAPIIQGEAVVALTPGANIATNAALGNIFTISHNANATLDAPTNATNGQKCIWRFKNTDSSAHTLTLASGAGAFRFGTTIQGTSATPAGKTDYIGAVYNSTDSRWDVIAYAKGYV